MAFVELMGQLEKKVETLKKCEADMNDAKAKYDATVKSYGVAAGEVDKLREELNVSLDALIPNRGNVRQFA